MTDIQDFKPDWVSAPGETIADILERRNLSLEEFAKRMGSTTMDAEDLLHGRAMITIEMARKLENVLGATAAFWMIRESQYREDITRRGQGALDIEWLKELPLKEMINFGWLRPIPRAQDRLAACLRFFDVPSVRAWRDLYHNILELAAFRSSPSFEPQPGAVAVWLRQGEIEGASIDCASWDLRRFQDALSDIRPLTRKKDPRFFVPELVKRCAGCGVAVVIVRAPRGCLASGATKFLSPTKALLMLSFRYLSDDHFWFTFFHEAGHLLLHGKKAMFLEGENMMSTKDEREANDFSARFLVPRQYQGELLQLPINALAVIKFARRVGISPGIVVGQLQHTGRLQKNELNTLKRRFKWSRSS